MEKLFKYKSIEEFVTDISTCPSHKIKDSVLKGSSFSGVESYEAAMVIARQGYELEKLNMLVKDVEKTESRMTMEVAWEVTGAVVDIGAFLSGVPENMMDFPIVEETKFIHIVMDTGELAGAGAKMFLNKSAATAWLVDHLENNGYRVKLDVFYSNQGKGHGEQAVMITVKEYQEPLALGQIAGAMHPGFFRRLIFRHIEKHYEQVPWGYGQVQTSKSTLERQLKEMADSDEIIFLPQSNNQGNWGANFNLERVEDAKKWAEYFMTNKLKLA